MFLRSHRIGRHLYSEALESYRDPVSSKPKHRCIARWRADRSFAAEIGQTQHAVETASHNANYYQGVIDRAVRPKFRKHYKQASDSLKFWRSRLNKSSKHLAALVEARGKGLVVDDSEIERAEQAEAARWRRLTSSVTGAIRPTPAPDRLATLAELARALMVQNDPDAVRAGLVEIADALDAMRQGQISQTAA
jgi:hypothetical protein